MNNDNLRPVRSVSEAREKGRKGGINSGRKRRKKREAKDVIRLLLNMDAEGDYIEYLNGLGIGDDDCTNLMTVVSAMFKKAVAGDVTAFKALMDYGGYAPDQELKDKERIARIEALSTDEGHEEAHVMIYLPDNGRDKEETEE